MSNPEVEMLQRALNRERDNNSELRKEVASQRTRFHRTRALMEESQKWICSEVCGTHHNQFCVKLMDFLLGEGKTWEASQKNSGLPAGRSL